GKMRGGMGRLQDRLKKGDFVEILTSKAGRGPSRDWLSLAASSRARNKIRQWFSRETREDQEQKGRESLESALKAAKLPYRKLAGSAVLAEGIRDMNFKKAEDFYLALRSGESGAQAVGHKGLQRLKREQAAQEGAGPPRGPG